jgi:hypothetical protein
MIILLIMMSLKWIFIMKRREKVDYLKLLYKFGFYLKISCGGILVYPRQPIIKPPQD